MKFHTCKLCPYRSQSSFIMSKHERFHGKNLKTCDSNSPEMLSCEFCVFETHLKVDLTEHVRVVHKQKRANKELKNILKLYRCKNCGFASHSLLLLSNHVDSCRTQFRGSSKKEEKSVPYHQTVYQKRTRWFKCRQCRFKCKQKTYLKVNVLKHKCVQCLNCKCKNKHRRPEDINCSGDASHSLIPKQNEQIQPSINDSPIGQIGVPSSSCSIPKTMTAVNQQQDIFNAEVMKLMLEIKEQNDQILKIMKGRFEVATPLSALPLGLPELPLKTFEDLDKLEKYLKNNDNFSSMLNYLSSVGGKDSTSVTYNLMKRCLSNHLSRNFNFCGKGSKKAFNGLLLKSVIVCAVRQYSTRTTEKEVEDFMKAWLKHAPERFRLERKQKK